MKNNVPILFFSRFISDLGTAIFKFALSLYVLDKTGSPAIFSLILTLSMLPNILMSILVGTIIDRSDKKKIIFWADIISGVTMFAFCIVLEFLVESIAILGLVVVVISIVQSFLNLGINSSLGNVVEGDDVAKVNSLFQAMGAIITILGPVISALLYQSIGIKVIMYINATAYFIGAGLTYMLVFTYKEPIGGTHIQTKIMDDIKYVFTYLKETKYIKYFMGVLAVLTFVYSPLTMVAIQHVMRITVKGSEFQLSFVTAALGIGAIIGAVMIILSKHTTDILKKLSLLLIILTGGIATWLLPLRMLENNGDVNLWLITLIFAIIVMGMGITYTMMLIPTFTYLQLEVPEHMRGRIFGIAMTAISIFGPLGVITYGQFLEFFKPQVTVMISILIMVIASAFSFVSKDFKSFKESEDL